MTRVAVPPLVGPGMILRRVLVAAREVVFFKGVIEANDGVLEQVTGDGMCRYWISL